MPPPWSLGEKKNKRNKERNKEKPWKTNYNFKHLSRNPQKPVATQRQRGVRVVGKNFSDC